MRKLTLTISDMKFQYKYGFYYLYTFLSVLYICIVQIMAKDFKDITAQLLVFTDPATIGIFFTGAIVLLEKSQRILPSLIVSPIKFSDYLFGKVMSFAFISVISAIAILFFSPSGIGVVSIITIALGSLFFSVLGMIAALNSRSMNEYLMLSTIFEIIFCLPGVLYIFNIAEKYLFFTPAAVIVQGMRNKPASIFYMIIWNTLLILITYKYMNKKYRKIGGAR